MRLTSINLTGNNNFLKGPLNNKFRITSMCVFLSCLCPQVYSSHTHHVVCRYWHIMYTGDMTIIFVPVTPCDSVTACYQAKHRNLTRRPSSPTPHTTSRSVTAPAPPLLPTGHRPWAFSDFHVYMSDQCCGQTGREEGEDEWGSNGSILLDRR